MSAQPFYHIRPNKYIDRCLFIDILGDLKKEYDIEDYTYIGFGSYYFDDHRAIHSKLGISKMLSLESDPDVALRAEYNIPYSCIKLVQAESRDYIDEIASMDDPLIVWFDYTDPKGLYGQFSEFCSLIDVLKSGDVFKITINANPSSLGDREGRGEEELWSARLESLQSRLEEYLPATASINDMKMSTYPRLLLQALRNAAFRVAGSPSPFSDRFVCPICSTVYGDGQQMLTLTCIMLESEEERQHVLGLFEKRIGARDAWEDYIQINIPELTEREILSLSKLLPGDGVKESIEKDYPFIFGKNKHSRDQKIDSFIRFYRSYPRFHHIEF